MALIEQKTERIICFVTCNSDIKDIVPKYTMFLAAIKKYDAIDYEEVKLFIFKCLGDLNIKYEYTESDDGIFIFPSGAKELDDTLVSEPLEWLSDYKEARKLFIKALKAYSNATSDNASKVADDFRKALEAFFQEFFNKPNEGLQALKKDYGNYLKEKGVPNGGINNDFPVLLNAFESFLNNYTLFNNKNSKHDDKTPLNCLEYILYQTGNIIRLLITLKNSEKTPQDNCNQNTPTKTNCPQRQ